MKVILFELLAISNQYIQCIIKEFIVIQNLKNKYNYEIPLYSLEELQYQSNKILSASLIILVLELEVLLLLNTFLMLDMLLYFFTGK